MKFNNILVPVHDAQSAKGAIDFAAQMAAEFNATIHLVSVIEDSVMPVPPMGPMIPMPISSLALINEAQRDLGVIASRLRVKSVIAVREGVPSRQIVNYAENHAIDLIVMATHGYKGFKRMLLGSTTESVLRRACCPVVSIRPPSTESSEADDDAHQTAQSK